MKKAISFLRRYGLILITVLLFLLLVIGVAMAQESTMEPDPTKLLLKEEPLHAVALMKDAVNRNPSAQNYFYLGYSLLKAGKTIDARQAFQAGIDHDSKYALEYTGLGYADITDQYRDQGLAEIQKGLDLGKNHDALLLRMSAQAYMTSPDLVDKALTLLTRAEALEPNDPVIPLVIGNAYAAKRDGGKAISNYEQSLKIDPAFAPAYYGIGHIYAVSGNIELAIASYRQAIDADSTFAPAYRELGEIYYVQKKGEDAVRTYSNYLSQSEPQRTDSIRYAYFLFLAKEYSQANAVFARIAVGADNETLRLYGYSAFSTGDYSTSAAIFESLLQSHDSIRAGDFMQYAKCLDKQGKDSLAVEALKKCIAMDPSQQDALQLLAEKEFAIKSYSIAAATMRKLIRLRPEPSAQDYYLLGRSCYLNQEFSAADSSFKELISLTPDLAIGYLWDARALSNLDPESESGLALPYYQSFIDKGVDQKEAFKKDYVEAYSYLGYYYYLKHQLDRAKESWERVLELDPADPKAQEALKALSKS